MSPYFFWVYNLGVELQVIMVIIYLTSRGTPATAPFCLPPSNAGGFLVLHFPADTYYVLGFDYRHATGCEVGSHRTFALHFPNDTEHLF